MARRHGSYDRVVITKGKSFGAATLAQKDRAIKKAQKCGCPSCQAWLKRVFQGP